MLSLCVIQKESLCVCTCAFGGDLVHNNMETEIERETRDEEREREQGRARDDLSARRKDAIERRITTDD